MRNKKSLNPSSLTLGSLTSNHLILPRDLRQPQKQKRRGQASSVVVLPVNHGAFAVRRVWESRPLRRAPGRRVKGGEQVDTGRGRSISVSHSTNITEHLQCAREVKQTNQPKKAEIFELGIKAHGQKEETSPNSRFQRARTAGANQVPSP